MSLHKKKHKNISNPVLRQTLLDLDDYLDLYYRFRCEPEYKGILGKIRACRDREDAEKKEAAGSGAEWILNPEEAVARHRVEFDSHSSEEAYLQKDGWA